MNYLAHALLSPADAATLTGNMITDMAKGNERRLIPAVFYPGMHLHNLIDQYTDSHTGLRMVRNELAPVTGRYTPVLLDIYMDFYLGQNWAIYCSLDKKDFEEMIYTLLSSQVAALPEVLAGRLKNMIRHKWLSVYWSVKNVEEVIMRLSARARTPELFINVQQGFELAYPLLDRTFPAFFDSLKQHLTGKY